MKQSVFMAKYPVFSLEIGKSETSKTSIDQLVDYFVGKINGHGKATMIAVFDHYAHTKSLGGEIAPEIQAAKNVVFCFGMVLPNAEMMAVRPRSIALVDLGDRFLVTFMEAPMPKANETMVAWAKDLVETK